MKSISLIAIVLVLVASLSACRRGNNTETTAPTETTRPTATTQTPTTQPTTEPTILPTIDPTLDTNIPDPSVDTSMPDATDGGMDGRSRKGGF